MCFVEFSRCSPGTWAFPRGSTTLLNWNRGAHTVEYTREPVAPAHLITSCVYGIFPVSRQHCLDSVHPRVLIVKTVAPCASNVVALHGSRRLKTYRRRARTNRTNNGRGAGRPLSRQRVSRSTQSLSPCRSRTSQVHGCLRQLLPVLQALPPEFHAFSSGRAKRACKRSLCGYGDLSHMGSAVGQYTWALSVLIRILLPEGMAYGHAKVETSCLLLHVLVACTLVELRQAFRRRKPQRWACRVARVLSVGWFDLIWNLDTSLVVFLRGICSGLGTSQGGIVYGLFSKEGLYVGKASVNRRHCPGLAARFTEHIPCLCRPGLKDANPSIDFSGADYGVFVSFHWLSSPRCLKP